MPRKPQNEAYFWSQVAIGEPSECWTWNGYTAKNGYGVVKLIMLHPVPVGAHRAAWAFACNDGVLPPTHVHIHHECENKRCCNPAHLLTLHASDHMAIHKGRGCHKHGLADWREKDMSCRICDRARGKRRREDPVTGEQFRLQAKLRVQKSRARRRADRDLG